MSTLTAEENYNETVRENIRNGSLLNLDYVFMNTMAAIIACYGLLANSPAVVIGAMIVAMLLGPILGTALALVDSNIALLQKAVFTLGGGILGIMSSAFLIGLIHSDIPLTSEIMARTAPNLMDLMIALAGGAAGAYATVAPRLSAAFVGVAIATALVPPLSSSSILLARGEYHLAFGAFLLAFTNIIAIQFASSLVMWFKGFRRVSRKSEQVGPMTFLKNNFVSLLILAALAISLTSNLHKMVSKQMYENKIRAILHQEIESSARLTDLADVRFEPTSDKLIIRAIVRGVTPPTAAQVSTIEAKLPLLSSGAKNELRIRFVNVMVINREGILSDDIEFGVSE
jgi:uncharacterized hydrophobic protein (TIGR00271 family)